MMNVKDRVGLGERRQQKIRVLLLQIFDLQRNPRVCYELKNFIIRQGWMGKGKQNVR